MTTSSMRGVLHSRTALFLDFDGTLAPLQDDPDAVTLPPRGGELLESLRAKLGGAVALVSGRDARDLARRVPNTFWRAGNHGDMIIPPGADEPTSVQEPPADLLAAAEAALAHFAGARLEKKARVLAFHTRACPHHEDALAAALKTIVDGRDDYKLQRGKDIAELKPKGVHKGEAIKRLMEKDEFLGREPLFLGDDTTDEDGFRTCLALNGSAMKIGEGASVAPHRLSDTEAVWRFLKDADHDLA